MIRLILSTLIAVILSLAPASVIATNADGAAALASCNFSNFFVGGIEVFSLDNQEGGSRVWCFQNEDSDPHFGGWPTGFSDAFTGEIGSFNDKTDSVRLRVNPGCEITVYLFYSTGADGGDGVSIHRHNTASTVTNYNVNVANNVISSGRVIVWENSNCDIL